MRDHVHQRGNQLSIVANILQAQWIWLQIWELCNQTITIPWIASRNKHTLGKILADYSKSAACFRRNRDTTWMQISWESAAVRTPSLQRIPAEHHSHSSPSQSCFTFTYAITGSAVGVIDETQLFSFTGTIPTLYSTKSIFMDHLCSGASPSKNLTAPWKNESWTVVNP